jgi:hypothetical protein
MLCYYIFGRVKLAFLFQKHGPVFTLGVPDNATQDVSSALTISKNSSDEEEDLAAYDYIHHQTSLLAQQDQSPCQTRTALLAEGKSMDLFLPDVGIVMSVKVGANVTHSLLDTHRTLDPFLRFQPSAAPLIDNVSLSRVVQNVSIRGHVLTHSRTDLSLDVSSLVPPIPFSSGHTASRNSSPTPSPHKGGVITPEIAVENTAAVEEERSALITALKASQKSLVAEGSCMEQVQSERKSSDESSVSQQTEPKSLLSSVKLTPPNTLHLARKLSLSSNEVDKRQGGKVEERKGIKGEGNAILDSSKNTLTHQSGHLVEGQRSSSAHDLSLSITSSQSESAIKAIRSGFTNVITSPAAATKDLVLSPFSKFAKGMQNLGANLDPRKLKAGSGTGIGRHIVTEHQIEEHRKLQEKWKSCRTRLIAL